MGIRKGSPTSKPELLIPYSTNERGEPLCSFQPARGNRAPLILGENLFLRAFSKEKSGGRGYSRMIWHTAGSKRPKHAHVPSPRTSGSGGIRRESPPFRTGVPSSLVSEPEAVCSPGPRSHRVAPVPSPHPLPGQTTGWMWGKGMIQKGKCKVRAAQM